MKQKLLQTFILIVFMVVCQSYKQRLEAATIIDKATTDELSSKVKEEGGIIKAQEGGCPPEDPESACGQDPRIWPRRQQ